jgi:hypothetical protein
VNTTIVSTEEDGRSAPYSVLRLHLASERMSVRDLIDVKVRYEIIEWRRRKQPGFGAEYGEWNLKRLRSKVNPDAEFAKALAALTEGRFAVIIDGRRIAGAEDEFDVPETLAIRFVRVAGGR